MSPESGERPQIQAGLPRPTLTKVERSVWAAWSECADNDPSPVKRIARKLDMTPADVAFIVSPAQRGADDREPDL